MLLDVASLAVAAIDASSTVAAIDMSFLCSASVPLIQESPIYLFEAAMVRTQCRCYYVAPVQTALPLLLQLSIEIGNCGFRISFFEEPQPWRPGWVLELEQACSTLVSFRLFAVAVCLERQREVVGKLAYHKDRTRGSPFGSC